MYIIYNIYIYIYMCVCVCMCIYLYIHNYIYIYISSILWGWQHKLPGGIFKNRGNRVHRPLHSLTLSLSRSARSFARSFVYGFIRSVFHSLTRVARSLILSLTHSPMNSLLPLF